MTPWIAAGFLVVGFLVLLRLFGLVENSRIVLGVSRRSLGVIRNASLSDEAKERALQSDAKELFRLFFVLAFGGAAALLLPLGVVWLCDWLGLLSLQAVFDVALSPAFLIGSGILAVFALFWKPGKAREAESYSGVDRLMHRVAFRTYPAQLALADLEDRLYAKELAPCKSDRPVFIAALPRAGTTFLLECCARVPEFAAHCYRDMPFLLIPCLWNRFSVGFRQAGQRQQRAHGDGMLIDFDSPEALEEVLWKIFWRRHYQRDRIVPWKKEGHAEFAEFFRSHMRKIILLRRGKDAATARYISKNNLNIARTGVLHRLFPDSVIVVPFREPLQHAASLLKQHRNFLRIHKEDRFASAYMRAIGHYDFGENLRPVDFDGWLDRRESKDTETLAFWLEYWTVGYRHLLAKNVDYLHFLNYDALCANPARGMQLLADVLGSRDSQSLLSAAGDVRVAKPHPVDTSTVPASVLQDVDRIYTQLKEIAPG
jgi:hypothetical protein